MTEFEQLLNRGGVNANPGASTAEIAAFERDTGLALSPDLRAMYSRANGARINARGLLELIPLTAVARYVAGFQTCGIPDCWGYFAFTDTNDSNPYCVCLAGPVAGYVVRVFHDDTASIAYRSLRSFLQAVIGAVDSGAALWDLPHELSIDTCDRTPADVATARALLAFAETLQPTSAERADAQRWALALFSEGEIADVLRLLDIGDEYCRGEALQKLGAMTAPEATEAIRAHQRESRAFARAVAKALRDAGIEVSEATDTSVRAEPGRVNLNLPMFFTHRKRPTILEDVVQRTRELIAYKTGSGG